MELDLYSPMSQVYRLNTENGRLFRFSVFSNGRKEDSFHGIHPPPIFHALIEKERARAERTGVRFSLACFDASKQNGTAMDALRLLAATLEGRTRDTDEVGWFDDSCIGVLLAGTGEEGARIYAKNIQSKTFGDPSPMDCRVYTYPSLWSSPKGKGNGSSMGLERSKESPGTIHELVSKKMPAWKRAIDILGSAAGLILLSPLFLLIAAVIKIVSPGPVFFRQDRVGHAGKVFTFLKFRTMHVNNDAAVHKQYLSTLIRGDQAMEKLDADRDPRIIRFGRFLRQSCLDELPQLINVLLGDMSLVGPRPCLPYEAQEYLLWHARRFDTVPGMTGLWQVNGKNKTTFKEMIRYDIAYSRQMSPWLDLSTLLKTVPTVCSLVMEYLQRKRAASTSPPAALIDRAS